MSRMTRKRVLLSMTDLYRLAHLHGELERAQAERKSHLDAAHGRWCSIQVLEESIKELTDKLETEGIKVVR